MKCALYLRQSLDSSGDEAAIKRQREDCTSLAKVRGWTVVEEFTDNDLSAAGKVERPGFEALMRCVDQGQVSVVVAWNLDRLTRNRPDTVRLIELGQKNNIIIALARGSDLDMSTPVGRMFADQLAGWARFEIEQKSDRHQRANRQKAEQGLPHKGRRAYGYEADGLTIKEEEAAILREMAQRFLSGWSYNEIAYDLNGRGITTAYGSPFYNVAIRQILTRKRYAGIREHKGVEYDAQWPAIFDPETWARLQYAIKERSAKYGNRPAPRKHLLTGLVVCGNCGKPMIGMTARDRKTGELKKIYRCHQLGRIHRREGGCGKVVRGAVPLEHFIKELICTRLDSPELSTLLAGTHGKRMPQLIEQQQAHVQKKRELLDLLVDGVLDKSEYQRAVSRVDRSMAAVQDEIEQLTVGDMSGLLGAGQTVRTAWDNQTDGWRRKLLSMLVEQVVVNPGRTLPRYKIGERTYYFATSLIDVKWKC